MAVFIRSFILIAILIGVAAGGISLAISLRTPPKIEKRAEPTVSVRTVNLRPQTHRPALFLIGKVEARDYATIFMPIEADVQKIAVREGDYFRRNEPLLKIDKRELDYTLAAEQAQLDELNAQLNSITRNRAADEQRLTEVKRLLELTQKDHERNQVLFEKKVLPLKQLEQSEQTLLTRQSDYITMQNQVADYDTQAQRLRAQLAATGARLEQTRLLQERARLRAPFDGRVVKVHTAVGARPARNSPLLEVFNPSELRLRVAIAQRYAGAVKAGDLHAVIDNSGAPLTLSYAGIEPQVETGNSSIDTFFALPHGDWVLGSIYDVAVELPPVEQVVAVPVDAIYNDRFLYRADSDLRAEAVECELIGLVRSEARDVQALARCPELREEDRVVADQLPNLLSGVLLNIVNAGG